MRNEVWTPLFLPPIGHKDRSSQINGSVASQQHVRRRTHIRPLTFVVALLAGLLLALPVPAHAANHQPAGTAFLNPSPGTPCPAPPSAYDSFPPS